MAGEACQLDDSLLTRKVGTLSTTTGERDQTPDRHDVLERRDDQSPYQHATD
jgi:hypothetical protein